MPKWWKLALSAVGVAGAVYLYYTEVKPVVIFGLRDDYAHAIPYQKIPDGLASLKAESCGQCHREIYEEWKTSIHAHAYEDPFFQAYWKKDKNIWVCLNCHTPLENQQPTLIKEIPRGRVEKAVQEPNPQFDAELRNEAITCAVSCAEWSDSRTVRGFHSTASHETRPEVLYRRSLLPVSQRRLRPRPVLQRGALRECWHWWQ